MRRCVMDLVSMQSYLTNKLETAGHEIFDDLVTTGIELQSIPENLFAYYFLPRILGEVESDTWMSEWIAVSGAPYKGVIVTKNGKPIFKTPPVLVPVKTNDKRPVNSIRREYETRSNHIKILAEKKLASDLNEIMPEYQQKPDAFLEEWMKIISRYRKISVKENNNSVVEDDGFDYD